MKITIWGDFACPYCYIGETRLFEVLDELGIMDAVMIEYRAFELDPMASAEVTESTPERIAHKYGVSLCEAAKMVNRVNMTGQQAGIDFKFTTTLYTNTRTAHRLMKLAQCEGRGLPTSLNFSMFDAYFVLNKVLSDRKDLLMIARAAGLDEAKAAKVIDSDLYLREVLADEREAAVRGIRAVPYFVINDETTITGAVDKDVLKKRIKECLKAEVEAFER